MRTLYALVIAWIAAYEVHVIAAPHLGVHGLFSKQVHLVALVAATVLCVARAVRAGEEAWGWALIALGIGTWTAGEIYYTQVLWDAAPIPVPSRRRRRLPAALPARGFAGLSLLLARQRVRGAAKTVWWTASCAALAVGALGAAVVFETVSRTRRGGRSPSRRTSPTRSPTSCWSALIVARHGAARLAPRPHVARCSAGVVAFWLADALYLVATAAGTYTTGGRFDIGWWPGRPDRRRRRGSPPPRRAPRAARAPRSIVMPLALRRARPSACSVYGRWRRTSTRSPSALAAARCVAVIGPPAS